jgi:hypothetical protein
MGEGGGGDRVGLAESYDRKKGWTSINHSLSGAMQPSVKKNTEAVCAMVGCLVS